MRRLFTLISICIILFLNGCSWSGSFYVVNFTTQPVYIEFELNEEMKREGDFAFEDTVYFKKASRHKEIDFESGTGEYEMVRKNNTTKYSLTLQPGFAITGGGTLRGFSYESFEERHSAFLNIEKFKMVRHDSQDTVSLSPAYLADFSRPIGGFSMGLILD